MAGGLVLTAAVCEQTRRFGIQKHLRIETTLLDNVVDALRSKLDVNIALLAAVVGLFNSSSEVNRQQFSTFFETVSLNTTQLKGVQGVGFARWIPAVQLQAYESRIRSEGFPTFTVRPPGPRANYSAIEFLEPFDWRNQRAFGFDMFSEPVRRQAMQRARHTGNATLTGKVQLVQETQEDLQRGVLIYLPIFADRGQVREISRQTLLGWAYSPLRINDVVNSAISGIDNSDLAGTGVLVFDGDQLDANRLLFDNLKLLSRNELRHPSYQTIAVAGRTWLVGVQLSPRLVGPNGIDSAYWMNLIVGLGSSLIAALLTRIHVSNHLATREALAISEAAAQERALASTVFEESG
jgi:CHASE1-domain containing sensor protein